MAGGEVMGKFKLSGSSDDIHNAWGDLTWPDGGEDDEDGEILVKVTTPSGDVVELRLSYNYEWEVSVDAPGAVAEAYRLDWGQPPT